MVQKNTAIFKTIIPEITKTSFNGILLVISNPVDILTYVTLKLSEYPTNRVIGSGTVLDSARLKCVIGERLDVDPRNVHARIVGEHGDSEFVLWSLANVSGVPINQYCELLGHFDHEESMKEVADHVKNSAYEIIEKKHATYYGIACAVKRICEAIIRDEKPILPISSYLEGEYGISDVVLSTPAIVGKNGLEYKVQVPINEEEQEKLEASAIALKEIIAQLDL